MSLIANIVFSEWVGYRVGSATGLGIQADKLRLAMGRRIYVEVEVEVEVGSGSRVWLPSCQVNSSKATFSNCTRGKLGTLLGF